MRRGKRSAKFAPFGAGILVGYAVTVAVCLLAAGVLCLFDAAAKAAGAAAVVALSIGSFTAGKTAGILRHRDGLKTGFICGALFVAPVAVISLIFGSGSWGGFALRVVLCISFGVVGGVAGVNKDE